MLAKDKHVIESLVLPGGMCGTVRRWRGPPFGWVDGRWWCAMFRDGQSLGPMEQGRRGMMLGIDQLVHFAEHGMTTQWDYNTIVVEGNSGIVWYCWTGGDVPGNTIIWMIISDHALVVDWYRSLFGPVLISCTDIAVFHNPSKAGSGGSG